MTNEERIEKLEDQVVLLKTFIDRLADLLIQTNETSKRGFKNVQQMFDDLKTNSNP